MTFEEVLDQAIAMLQRRGRVTYRALQRQFNLDDAFLDDLKGELLYGQRLAVDEDGRVLVWVGAEPDASVPRPTPEPTSPPGRALLAYTPAYLTEKILAARPTLEGERKQITVLFADLKGSTELIRDLDPETAQHLLDPALQHMMEAVHRYEGTVNQVLGDGIMALFGAPIAHEDHRHALQSRKGQTLLAFTIAVTCQSQHPDTLAVITPHFRHTDGSEDRQLIRRRMG